MTNHSFECTSYSPGHRVHWIQERLARAEQPEPSTVILVLRRGSEVDVIVDAGLEVWRFHDTPTTQRPNGIWTPGTGVKPQRCGRTASSAWLVAAASTRAATRSGETTGWVGKWRPIG